VIFKATKLITLSSSLDKETSRKNKLVDGMFVAVKLNASKSNKIIKINQFLFFSKPFLLKMLSFSNILLTGISLESKKHRQQ